MSGPAYGTGVLHVAPEAAAGGAFAVVENGAIIELDVAKRGLELLVAEEELAQRRRKWKEPEPPLERGYWRLYFDPVLQANEGADLDFLAGKSGDFGPRGEHRFSLAGRRPDKRIDRVSCCGGPPPAP